MAIFEIDDVEVVYETDAALLCAIEGEEVWIPKSQIDEMSEVVSSGDMGTLVVTEWLAAQKGLV